MAYLICLEKAALRHFDAAEHLYNDTHRKDVAGYLYGISAECAIKEILSRSGFRSLLPQVRKNNPFFAHFPELKALLRNHLRGRYAQALQRFIEDQYMQEWDVKMRYAPSSDIDQKVVARWREQAKQAISAMNGTLGRT